VICTVVGYTLWYVVIRQTEVNIAGLTVLTQPMAGWLLSVLWLGEPVHSGQFWGALAIIAGLILGLTRTAAEPKQILFNSGAAQETQGTVVERTKQLAEQPSSEPPSLRTASAEKVELLRP